MTRVVVVGRDAALWLAAAALRRALAPASVTVEAVELPTALSPASVYASLPPLEALHARIGIDEAALLCATGGAFSLGHRFAGPPLQPFFHGWGSHGAPINGHGFFPFWAKARAHGLNARLQDFSLTATAATNGRMMLPDEATGAFGRTDYAYHLPARAYVGALKGLAPRLGVVAHQTRRVAAELDGETGAIGAVVLDDGRRIVGDLFVDTSGGEAALISAALGVGCESWRDHFPADRRLVAQGPGFRSVPPFAEVRAGPAGWLRLHPVRADTRIEQVYAADLTTDAEALAAAQATAGMPLADVTIETIDPGRREVAWRTNCIAVGEAACAFDPTHSVDLHATQLGIVHLLSLFPTGGGGAAERDEYNRIVCSSFERIRDFQQALYALASWPGAFWDRRRGSAVSPELAHKIATFRARGEVAPMEDETFLADSWQALLIGLGVMPESWSPVIDRTSPETIKAAFRGMLGFIKDKVLEQPTHDGYLADLVGRAA